MTPPEMVRAYLGGTPLADYVETQLPFALPYSSVGRLWDIFRSSEPLSDEQISF